MTTILITRTWTSRSATSATAFGVELHGHFADVRRTMNVNKKVSSFGRLLIYSDIYGSLLLFFRMFSAATFTTWSKKNGPQNFI